MKTRIAGLVCSLLLIGAPLQALVVTWTGAAGDANIANGANWDTDPSPPANNDSLLFPYANNRLVTLNSTIFTAGNISFVNATNFSFSGTGSPTLNLAGDFTLQNTNVNFLNSLYVQLTSGAHTFTNDSASTFETRAVIGGTGSLVKSGEGLFTIYSVNTYSGGTTVSDGTLRVDASLAGSASISHASANLTVGGPNSGTLEIKSGGTVTNAQGMIGANNGDYGTVALQGSGSAWTSSSLYVGNGGYGELYLYDGAKLNVGNGSGVLNLGHSATGAGILKIGTDGEGYYSGGIINAAEITTGAGLSGELKFVTNGTAENPYYLTKDGLSNGEAVLISGPTEVEQVHGYTVLKEANTYSGDTHVSGGVLIVSNQDALGTSTVTVNGGTLAVNNINLTNDLVLSSGTLAGNGHVPTATIGTNFTLAPGFPATGGRIGSLDFGHLELASGGTLEWNLQNPNGTAGTDWDLVTISTLTTLNITATTGSHFTLKLISLDLNGALGTATGFIPGHTYSWEIFSSDSTTGFDPAKFDINLSQFTTDSADIANISLTNIGDNLYLNFTPVPEPSTWALLALGLGATGFAAWRKRGRV